MSIHNRNQYKPEIIFDFEAQATIGTTPEFVEVCENLYEDRVTTWYEYVPTTYQEGVPMPLVLQMHGGGGDGLRDALGTDWYRIAQERGFIVVYPNSYRYGRWECDDADIETIRRLIDRICERYTIDRSRIYMQGMSNGDMITTAFALEYPEVLAAAGFIAGPLPKEMIPHLPKGALPCIQIRGEKDVHFGQKMEMERADVYRPKAEMNDYNRRMWMVANHTEEIPHVYLRGKDNFFVYKGSPCDVVYWEVKDMGHRYPANVAGIFWDYFYSGWARVNGESIRLAPLKTFLDEPLQFAIAVGGKGVFQKEKVDSFVEGGNPECLLVHPARREEDAYFDVGEMLLTSEIYVPIETLKIGFGGSYEIVKNGSEAVFQDAKGRAYRFFKESSVVLEDHEIYSLKKPCFYRYGIFFVPIVEVVSELFGCFTAQTDGVVAVSGRPVELSKGAARILAHLMQAPASYPEPVIVAEDSEKEPEHVQ